MHDESFQHEFADRDVVGMAVMGAMVSVLYSPTTTKGYPASWLLAALAFAANIGLGLQLCPPAEKHRQATDIGSLAPRASKKENAHVPAPSA
jgi:hypothetical protein